MAQLPQGRAAVGRLGALVIAAPLLLGAGSPAPSMMVDAVDPCALAAADEIRPLVARMPLEIRPVRQVAQDGGAECVWSAVDAGLVPGAPPRFQLGTRVYHLASVAETARLFRESFPGAVVPGLARTADAADEVARPDPDVVAVRHGSHVVVVDGSGQQQEVRSEPSRVFRMEALALRMAGATVLGPVDGRMLQDPCSMLPPQQVLGVLTREPSSLSLSADGGRCTASVKDGTHIPGHWVENRGEVEIRRSDLGTNAAALAFQHQQTPFLPVSPLVRTADGTDRVVANTSTPGEAWAVHGPYYVELEVTNPTEAARAAPGWLYRVQRLALEAAGASVLPQGAPPDPVVPGPLPEPGTAEDVARWVPAPHPAPRLAWLSDPAVAALAFFARHRFLMMPVLVFAPIGVASWLGARRGRGGHGGPPRGWPGCALRSGWPTWCSGRTWWIGWCSARGRRGRRP